MVTGDGEGGEVQEGVGEVLFEEETVQVLLGEGIALNDEFWRAVEAGDVEAVQLLLGADMNMVDKEEETALDWARVNGQMHIVLLFLGMMDEGDAMDGLRQEYFERLIHWMQGQNVCMRELSFEAFIEKMRQWFMNARDKGVNLEWFKVIVNALIRELEHLQRGVESTEMEGREELCVADR